MKLFSVIAIAAIISGSFLIPVPADARSPWDYFGKGRGIRYYSKLTTRTKDKVTWTGLTINDSGKSTYNYWLGDCNKWTVDVQVNKNDKFLSPTADVPPGTTLDAIMTKYCA